MENRHVSEVIGNPNAPYETQLAASCGTGTNFSHAGQPSLPNYIAATSGDTQGIVDNGHPLSHPLTVDNLFRQVRNGGGTARTYAESMPTPCWAGETGEYTYITNPALYYSSLGDAAACLADDVPMGTIGSGALAADIDAGTLPTFANLVPDLCGNSHDCPVAAGDAWLAQWVPRILAGANYRTQATAVFVVWDEFTPMPFIVVSPTTRPGTVVSSSLDHYGLLRTTEEMLGLPFLGRAGSAASMRPGFGL
jgi:phospholipase C